MPARGAAGHTAAGAGRSASPASTSDAARGALPASAYAGAHILKHFKGHGDFVGKVVRVQTVPGFPFRVK